MDGFDYALHYDVPAVSKLDAIATAVGMLRSNVKLNGVLASDRISDGYWHVELHVHEEPIDHPAEATFAS